MIHVIDHGDGFLTMGQLAKVPVPDLPNAGSHWKPIQHATLMNHIIDEVEERGWTVQRKVMSVTPDGSGLAAALLLSDTGIYVPNGIELAVGIMADNSQRRAVRLFTGGSVTICNNGLATGEQVLMRKHTKNFDIAGAVSEAFDGYVEKSQKLADLVAHLQETPITYSQAGKALAAASSSKIMGAALLFEVSQEFMNPRHPEHGNGTAWGLLNAFTEIVKKTTPVRQLERINEFRHIVLAV